MDFLYFVRLFCPSCVANRSLYMEGTKNLFFFPHPVEFQTDIVDRKKKTANDVLEWHL